MPSVTLRDLTPDDHDAWLPLWRAYQVFYKADIPAAISRVTWARMLDPAEHLYGAIAHADGAPVGIAHWLMHRSTWSVANFCYLNDLFVAPEVRGQGIGRRLIEHATAAAQADGCSQLYWHTHETNTTAQRLYNTVATRTGFIHYNKPLAT